MHGAQISQGFYKEGHKVEHRRQHYAVIGAAISVNAHSPACLSFHPTTPLSVLWELHDAIDFNGKCMRSSSEFSEGSFMVIIYGKLL